MQLLIFESGPKGSILGSRVTTRRYHDATKHSEISLRTSAHYLDWSNKPAPFKVYKDSLSILLPRDFPLPNEPALEAIRGPGKQETGKALDLKHLTEVLYFTAGLTRKMRFGSELHYMRAASATGALYPIEIYVITSSIDELDPGVYHFNPLDLSLVRVSEGDYSGVLAETTDNAQSSAVTIAMTSLAWRNAWKYEARSYRHWFWDTGVMAANLLAVCHSEHFDVRVLLSFIDSEIDKLLGLDPGKEATVALARINESQTTTNSSAVQEVRRSRVETEKLSRDEVEYPIIWETNAASALSNRSEVHSWRQSFSHESRSPRPDFLSREPSDPLARVILRRGSTRKFVQKPISRKALTTILETSTGPVPLDFQSEDETLIDFYMIVNDVEELEPGSYYYDGITGSIVQLKAGKMRYMSGYLCLNQLLFSDASVVFFLMTDLGSDLDRLGERGYRAAQFEAGIRAGKIYLGSYAQGIGASGSTFFDDPVTEFFSPHAKDKSTMIAVGVGIPAYKARPGRILPQFKTTRP